jgi:hypothetical protein
MIQAAILLIFLTAVISSILVGTISAFTYYQELTAVQRDKANLTYISKQIITNIKYVGGEKSVPLGVDGTDYHELPDWLMFDKNNSFGIPYMYCPYSLNNTLTANNTILLNDTTTYEVQTINTTATNNNDYLIASDPSPVSNVLILLVSLKLDTTAYTCSDITFVDNKFQLPDPTHGRVQAITSDSILASDLVKTENYSIEQSNDTLTTTLSSWNTNQPDRFVITLKSGDIFDLNTDLNLENAETGKRKEIFISGESSVTLSELSNTATNTIQFSNVILRLKNLDFSGKYSFELDNVELYVENSNVKNIIAKNSNVTFDGVTVKGINLSATTPLTLQNSTLTFKEGSVNNFTMSPSNKSLIYSQHSNIKSVGTTLNFSTRGSIDVVESFNTDIGLSNSQINLTKQTGTPNSLFWVDSTSELSLYTMDINQSLSNSFIHTFGKVAINNSSISLDDGSNSVILLNRGAHLEMNYSNIINDTNSSLEPLYGIKDLGGIFIGGEGNTIYAKTNCLNGDLFNKTESIIVVDDTIASVNGDFSVNATTNNDSITFNIRDYFNKFTTTCY